MSEHVILLHGIWMRGFTMTPLARRLREAGFASVEALDYASVSGTLDVAIERLADRLRTRRDDQVHVVGHSLGGMLALELAGRSGELPQGRIVCLGSPLRGSATARGAQRWPGAGIVMGHSAEILVRGFEQWRGTREVGVVAGRTPLGLGRIIGALDGPHDGTVSVAETMLPGITDHRVVASTHSGLVFSAEVAQLVAMFLRSGRFPPAQATA